MDALIYFAVWGLLIFLMMRMGCGAHVTGHRRDKPVPGSSPGDRAEALRWVAPERDTDPVCGVSVRTSNAKPSVHDGAVFYFCSRECREIFEAAPEQYVSPAIKDQATRPEHSDV